MRTGHGRAQIQVLQHGIGDGRAALVDACLTSLVFDPQTHGSRGEWLVNMVDRANMVDEVIDAIAHANSKESTTDFWSGNNRCAVLKAIAERSLHPLARQILYRMVCRVPDTSDVVGVEQVVELDGLDGLLFVARRLGVWLGEDAEFRTDDTPIAFAATALGKQRAHSALEAVAKSDADVARYMRAVRDASEPTLGSLTLPPQLAQLAPTEISNMQQAHRSRMRAVPASEVIADARHRTRAPSYPLVSWGWNAETAALEEVFAALVREPSPVIAGRLLRVFSRVGVPRYHAAIRRLADAGGSAEDLVLRALSKVGDPRVRDMALVRLARVPPDPAGVRLLIANFAPGDHSLIERALDFAGDDDQFHATLMSALDVFDVHHRESGPQTALMIGYERSPCEVCRARVVKQLHVNGHVPDWIREEVRFDANEELQGLAAR